MKRFRVLSDHRAELVLVALTALVLVMASCGKEREADLALARIPAAEAAENPCADSDPAAYDYKPGTHLPPLAPEDAE